MKLWEHTVEYSMKELMKKNYMSTYQIFKYHIGE